MSWWDRYWPWFTVVPILIIGLGFIVWLGLIVAAGREFTQACLEAGGILAVRSTDAGDICVKELIQLP